MRFSWAALGRHDRTRVRDQAATLLRDHGENGFHHARWHADHALTTGDAAGARFWQAVGDEIGAEIRRHARLRFLSAAPPDREASADVIALRAPSRHRRS